MAIDFAAEGLLDGLEGDDRKARLELLERLATDGVPLSELKAAVAQDRLALVPLEGVLGGSYTAREVAERADIPIELWTRLQRALGLPEAGPEDRLFGDVDVAAARAFKLFLDSGLPADALMDVTRVMGEGSSRLAATITAAFADAFLQPGDTEQDVALRFALLTEKLVPGIPLALAGALNAHLRASIRRGMIGQAEREAGRVADAQEMVVCFADLVGFTRLGGEVGVQELGTVAGRLAELATEVTEPPVRLVKTIGDAAMFVSPEPGPMVEAALSLVEAVQAADLPALRAGVASGPTVIRAGDFYGHSVNLASRVTGVARPGSLLCTEEVRDRAGDGFSWSFAGKHRLKGISEPVALYRARRPDSEEDAKPERAERAEEPPRDERREKPSRASRSKADRRRRRAKS
jgi:adenylate cyclase